MTERHESIDGRLSRLAAATESLRPRPDFRDRVLAAVAAERAPVASSRRGNDWLAGVAGYGRWALATAALFAAIAVASAAVGARAFDSEAALAYGSVELEPW
jgi:hypothetical protein